MGEGGVRGERDSFPVEDLWTSQRPNNGATRVCYCAGIRPFCGQLRLMPGAR